MLYIVKRVVQTNHVHGQNKSFHIDFIDNFNLTLSMLGKNFTSRLLNFFSSYFSPESKV